jgi:hypothetical protein
MTVPATTSMPTTVADLASALRDRPTHELVEYAAELLSQLAARKGKGAAKSIALLIRNHLGTVDEATQERVRARAKSMVAHVVPAIPLSVPTTDEGIPGPDWSLARAAAHLGLHAVTLERRLVDPLYRRLYGWPWYDGHVWRFRSAALDARTSARVMAELPSEEPFHLLPVHCSAQSPEPAWVKTLRGNEIP